MEVLWLLLVRFQHQLLLVAVSTPLLTKHQYCGSTATPSLLHAQSRQQQKIQCFAMTEVDHNSHAHTATPS